MKAALDVHYEQDRGVAACVMFRDWRDDEPANIIRVRAPAAKPYRPGRFFERELPCLLAVLREAGREFDTLLIDGYVHLKEGAGKGLGAHLHESLPYAAAVIGVAKNPLRIAERFIPVLRGHSKRPLFVSAVGCPLEKAARFLEDMHGPYRLPTLLKIADQLAGRY